MCKPNKMGKGLENKLGHRGFANLRREFHARVDALRVAQKVPSDLED